MRWKRKNIRERLGISRKKLKKCLPLAKFKNSYNVSIRERLTALKLSIKKNSQGMRHRLIIPRQERSKIWLIINKHKTQYIKNV